MAIKFGTNGNDTLTGGNDIDIIFGRRGHDTINGGGGRDFLFGGEDDDVIHGGGGNDFLFGEDGDDSLFGDDGDDIALGGSGNDFIDGGAGNDLLIGGSGSDEMHGGAGNDEMSGGTGSDVLLGDEGNDIIAGESGDDVLVGGAGNDQLDGGDGTDVLLGGDGNDRLEGGSSSDVLEGEAGNDRLFGGSGDDLMNAGEGNDRLEGGAGNDRMDGGAGNDTVLGGSGDDIGIYTASENVGATDSYDGGRGFDTLRLNLTNAEANAAAGEISAYQAFLAANANPNSSSGATFTFSSLGLTVRNFEALEIARTDGEPPVLDDQAFGIDENSEAGTEVGQLVLGDLGGNSANSLASGLLFEIVGGSGQALFSIDPETGVLTVASGASLDFESTPNLDLVIKVTDSNGLSDTATIAIGLNDVNEAPSAVQLSASDVAENAAAGAVIGTLSATDQDAGDSHSFSVSDARFEVVGNELRLAAGASLDHETEGSIQIEVTATDAGGLQTTQSFTINVTDVNEAPSAVQLSNATVQENVSGAVIGAVTVVDQDVGDEHALSVDDNRFEIVDGNLQLKSGVSLNHEAAPEITVNVTAVDQGGNSLTQAFTITVGDVNEAPHDIALSGSDLNEHTLGAVVGTLSATDPDAGDEVTFSVDDSRFEVVDGALKLKDDVSLDHNTISELVVEVTATDKAGLSRTESFSINVVDINDAPSAVQLSANEIAENAAAGTVIGSLSATDQDVGDTHQFTVSDSRFEVVNGELRLAEGASLDHETEGSIEVQVTATDSGNASFTQTFTINVTDVNEAPTAVQLSANEIAEDAAAGAVVGILSATDQDVGDSHSFTVSDSRFVVDGNQLKLAEGVSLDHETEGSIEIQVTASDGEGLTTTQSFTINVTDVNEAPTAVQLSANEIAEDAVAGTVIGTLSATDQDVGDTHSFMVSDARFEIVSGELRLAAGASLDHETEGSIQIEVMATDAGGLSTKQSFTINVSDVNEAPANVELSANTIAEDATAGAVIGTLSATDQDVGDTVSFSVNDSRFVVEGNELRLADGASLDHETEGTIDIEVTASDLGGLTTIKTFTINVTDVNEAPSAVQLSNAAVAENAVGAVVGTLSVTDQDAGDTHTFSVNDDRFEVVGTDLKLKAGLSLNHEAHPSVTVEITAMDAGGLTKVQSFTINVTDVNEAPNVLTLDGSSVDENAFGAVIGNLTVADPDANDTLTISVSDARFEVVNGALKLRDEFSLDHETEATVNVEVTVTDAGGLSRSEEFAITVNDVNEEENQAPTGIQLANASVDENAAGAAVGALSVVDPNEGDTHSFIVSDDRFEVDGGVLKLKAGESLNHEAEGSIEIHVTATDSGGLSVSETFSVTVNNVNETPTAIDLSANTVAENEAGATIGALTVTDPDAGDSHNFSVSDNRFEVFEGSLKLKDGQSLNHEAGSTVQVQVTATDLGGLSKSQTFTINVTDVNEAPTNITLSNLQVEEHVAGGVVGTLGAIDPDAGDSSTFQVSDSRFEVVGNTLKLKDGEQLDHSVESSVTLQVTAVDGGALTFSKSFTITVDSINDAPTGITLSNDTIQENQSGVVIGTLTVADPDGGDSHTFEVDDARFEVVNGALKLKNTATLNHETASQVVVQVTATDSGGLDVTESFTINVTNVNEAPTISVNAITGFQFEGDPVVVDGSISIADQDTNQQMGGATVAITVGFQQGDALSFNAGLGVDGSYDAITGVLSLTGNASIATYKAVLESVTFHTIEPGNGDRVISFSVTDDQGLSSAVDTATVIVTDPGAATAIDLAGIEGQADGKFQGIDGGANFGAAVGTVGDVNNDGFADVIVGANKADPNGLDDAGSAFVIFGREGGFDGVDLANLAPDDGFRIDGASAGDGLGSAVAGLGDFNGDGVSDFAVASPGATPAGAAGPGQVQVMLGGNAGTLTVQGFDNQVGGSISIAAAGDVNGDGVDDMIIGVEQASPDGRTNAGETIVIYGQANAAGTIDVANLTADQGFRIAGAAAGDGIGMSVASAGDVNGDGIADMVIASPGSDPSGRNNAGQAFIVYGQAGGSANLDLASFTSSPTTGFRIIGATALDNFLGIDVSSAGDVNGDGFDDLVVGFSGASPDGAAQAGEAYVVFGSAGVTDIDLAELTTEQGFQVRGGAAGDAAGISVSAAGDVNGDGLDDLIVSAVNADPNGREDSGEVYVLFGRTGNVPTIDLDNMTEADGVRISGAIDGDLAGFSVAAAGDVNGDGFDDIIIGSPGAAGQAGESTIIFGADFGGLVSSLGFADDDILDGSEDSDFMVGGLGNDVLNGNSGADVLNGGGGDDLIVVGDLGFAEVDGGSGNDTLLIDAFGAVNFGNLDGDPTTSDRGKINGIETIDLTNGAANAVTLSLSDVLDMNVQNVDALGTAFDNMLAIMGENNDTLQLIDDTGAGWSDTGESVTQNGVTYQIYAGGADGAIKVAVDSEVNVTMG